MVDTFQRRGVHYPYYAYIDIEVLADKFCGKSQIKNMLIHLITAQIYLWKEAKKGEPQKYG